MTTRREFLKYAALSGSALVIGIRRDTLALSTAPEFTPNAWLAIDETGTTTLTIGKQEMGQGVRTSLAMILADELDADWSRVNLVQASPSETFKTLGTGGSWSVGGSWRPLRNAGAAAREMLITAAAARWGVDTSRCRTENGFVIHDPSGRRIGYGALVADASRLPVPGAPRLKTASERRVVGTRVRRLDTPHIVTGRATYGIDVRVPGMVFATLIRPPKLGAKPVGVDSSAAQRVAGFHSHVVPVAGGVAVVGRNTWAALAARRAVKVEWDNSAAIAFESDNHWRVLERAVAEPGVVTRREGDPAATVLGSRTVEARYYYPFEAHATLEPMNCVAHVHDGRCEIWVPTQAPNALQQRAARLLGVDPSRVSVTPTLVGGGFGRRLAVDYALEAVELSRKIAAPVQLLWTREDDIKHGHFQNASVHQLSAVVNAAGSPLVWRHKKVASPHNLSGPPTAEDLKDPVAFYQDCSWGVYDIPYAIPAIETSYVRVDIPLRIGPWRSVFSPSSTYARECFLDELAHAAHADPMEFRLSLLDGADTVKAGSLTIDRRRLRSVLELVRERSGWNTPLPPGRARGVACNVYDGETHVAYVAEVSVPRTTKPGYLPFIVYRMVCAIDCGVVINPLGIEQQVEGGVMWALSNMKAEITVRNGSVEQSNFADFPVVRMTEAPVIETHIIPSHGDQPFGVGEPPVPPAIPAIVNALFAATGRRIRRLPIRPKDLSG